MVHDRTLVQIRERSFLDILDLALVVIRRRPLTIGLAALGGAAPFAALNAWLMMEQGLPFGAYLLLLAMELPWATAPLTIVLAGLMFGERPSIGRTLKTLVKSLGSLVLFQLILRGILLVTMIFWLVVPVRLGFLNEVILLERGRWRASLRRCTALSSARGGDLFGQWMLSLFFGISFVLAFWAGSGALIQALLTSDLTWDPTWNDLVGPRFHFAVWLAIEFFTVARFFNYVDQRIRLEGWEVELRVRAVGRALEEARRW